MKATGKGNLWVIFDQIYRFVPPIVNRELREMTYYLFYLTTRRVKIIIYYHTI